MKTDSEVLEFLSQGMRDNPESFSDDDLIEVMLQATRMAFHQLAPHFNHDFSGELDLTIHSLGIALLRYDQHRPQIH